MKVVLNTLLCSHRLIKATTLDYVLYICEHINVDFAARDASQSRLPSRDCIRNIALVHCLVLEVLTTHQAG